MTNPRFLIHLPILLLLGSCVPLAPQTTVYVYNGGTRVPESRTPEPVTKVQAITVAGKKPVSKECKKLEAAALRAYKLPDEVNLSKIDPNDDRAVVDELLANNKILRAELTRLQHEFLCTFE